ncbi:MAG: rRNA ((1402)-N(4))-methyltransferase RsmH [Verrucomicrobiota bacterium]|jgi:16S rRNA (cytosine1402-N4)-methyltransferase
MIFEVAHPISEIIEPEELLMSVDPNAHGYHLPVLLREVIEHLAPGPGKVMVDCTLGGGGHSEALLESGARVIGIDQDPDALAHAGQRLSSYGEMFTAVQASFHEIEDVLRSLGVDRVDGILADLGVSSYQLDTASRGFSFQRDGALDMRMSPSNPVTAATLVNTAAEEELARIFRDFGDEPASRRVAARIVRERVVTPFSHTLQLAETVASVIPKKSRIHPATRIFQALRIAVNREYEVLDAGLEAFTRVAAPGARVGLIAFHSGEDRRVKHYFKERAQEFTDRPEWPSPRPNPLYQYRLITSRPVIAGELEQRANPRSRSAKLRVAERLPKN